MQSITKNSSFHVPFLEYPRAPDFEMNLRILWGRGIFDRKSFENLMAHTKTHDVAVDIGSHVGSWAIPMSKSLTKSSPLSPRRRTAFTSGKTWHVRNARTFTCCRMH
jgi:hypothetical protein